MTRTNRKADRSDIVRVERGAEVSPGIFVWHVPALGLRGRSHQPLLDACRQIQSILGDPCHRQAAMYREGKDHPDMTCPVDVGAKYRVSEESKGGIRFRRFDRFDRSAINARADRRAALHHPMNRGL
jgi:hypothetical protein